MEIKTLTDQFCEHSSFIRGYSPCTIKRYRYSISIYVKFSGISHVEEANEKNIREFFLYGRTVRHWSANSFITFLKSLVVFFRWCQKEKYIEINPAEDMELPKVEKKLPPRLTKQEAMRLLEIAYNYPYQNKFSKYRNQAVLSVFLFAGLRKKELLNLRYADVDLLNRSIFVRMGKGSKDRVVPICDKLAEILKRYLAERQNLGKSCPGFFTALNKNLDLSEDGLKRLMLNITRAMGKNFGVHKLRHTFATLMLEGGSDIFSLSKMMGHSDIKTTTIYLAASAEHLRSQIGKHPLNHI
ncbi:MAG: tyrosine-type recombinase/integrase [Candidatus Buchananbacteria bacterium]|nr:tyrosine-type recombinase/integrase [Candidatus Buchananbacteria bacterium]